MSKSISFRDLRLIPELSSYNEIAMLQPRMDHLISGFLKIVGFDLDYPVEYVPSLHRDMQGKVALGFRCVGEVSCNRADINSPFCDLTDRLVAASYLDTSLMDALSELVAQSPDYASLAEDGQINVEEMPALATIIFEDNWEDTEAQITVLYDLRDKIRGSAYNESGALKMPEEYHEEDR